MPTALPASRALLQKYVRFLQGLKNLREQDGLELLLIAIRGGPNTAMTDSMYDQVRAWASIHPLRTCNQGLASHSVNVPADALF